MAGLVLVGVGLRLNRNRGVWAFNEAHSASTRSARRCFSGDGRDAYCCIDDPGSLSYIRNQDYQSAISIWSDVVRKAPHNTRGHNNLGSQLLKVGRIDEAIDHFRHVIKLAPRNVDAHFNLGRIRAMQQRVADSASFFWLVGAQDVPG